MQNKKNFAFGHCLRSEGIVCMTSGSRKESGEKTKVKHQFFNFTKIKEKTK